MIARSHRRRHQPGWPATSAALLLAGIAMLATPPTQGASGTTDAMPVTPSPASSPVSASTSASLSASAPAPASASPAAIPTPQRIADGIWVLEGALEHFSRRNGGDIVNTGIIDTPDGAIVIDSGPSLRYGKAQREAARQLTGHDVRQVYITHAHPDHFLGSQAYEDVPVEALAPTVRTIQRDGESLTQNLYLLVGGAMSGTVPRAPTALPRPAIPSTPGTSPRQGDATTVTFGGRRLKLIALAGHTSADLAVFDERTGTLFTGDLVFFDRAPTTPNADLNVWLTALEQLQALPYKVLVPGHGPVVHDGSAIAQTRDYLQWVRDTLASAAADGLDMNEVMRTRAPERLQRLAVLEEEWQRTVMHLYPAIEEPSLPPASPR